jgi:hypothetical protein
MDIKIQIDFILCVRCEMFNETQSYTHVLPLRVTVADDKVESLSIFRMFNFHYFHDIWRHADKTMQCEYDRTQIRKQVICVPRWSSLKLSSLVIYFD